MTVQANQAEISYDHEHATRLIEDSALSPESTNKLLNPYQARSGDLSSKRFSSMNNKGCSPANLRLEPVKIVPTTAFEEPQPQPRVIKETKIVESPKKEASRSPLKKSAATTPSPAKRGPASPAKNQLLSSLQFNAITEESPASPDAGNPVLAQSIYENLKRMDEEMKEARTAQASTTTITDTTATQKTIEET